MTSQGTAPAIQTEKVPEDIKAYSREMREDILRLHRDWDRLKGRGSKINGNSNTAENVLLAVIKVGVAYYDNQLKVARLQETIRELQSKETVVMNRSNEVK